MNVNERSDLSRDSSLKIQNRISQDTNFERKSSEISDQNNSETARLIKHAKKGDKIRDMPTPQLETQKNYWIK